MNYWLVRAKWGVENKKAEFINNDEWINGYEDKYLEIVKRVETEDILLLADDSTITHYGKCIDNPKDGKHLTVDRWILLTTSIDFSAKDLASKAIFKINEELIINNIQQEIENTIVSNELKIKSIEIENFTVFKSKHNLTFSDGLNVIVGENSAGKSHLIKLLYSLIEANNNYDVDFSCDGLKLSENEILKIAITIELNNSFKTDNLTNLISKEINKCYININFTKYSIDFEINPKYISDYNHDPIFVISIDNNIVFYEKDSIFIPAKEILSFYEGFVSLYENREISFEKIYYDLANSLSLSNLKNIESYPVEYKILCKLEEILEGKILLERGRFYLVSHKDNRKIEITLIAEGLRKIGMIAQLLANGSLTKNSILFWDEPETNLNPRLIRKMAEVLMELSRAGMQIFIATHSLFLVKEIEILREKTDMIKYFGLGVDENKEIRVSQSEDFECLDDIVLLDEELAQDDRFLAKEEV